MGRCIEGEERVRGERIKSINLHYADAKSGLALVGPPKAKVHMQLIQKSVGANKKYRVAQNHMESRL